jgi:hypothetical protein
MTPHEVCRLLAAAEREREEELALALSIPRPYAQKFVKDSRYCTFRHLSRYEPAEVVFHAERTVYPGGRDAYPYQEETPVARQLRRAVSKLRLIREVYMLAVKGARAP